jgi:hypothetical protein
MQLATEHESSTMRITTEHLSCAPGGGINEDLIRVFTGAGLTDILVLDGATSVAVIWTALPPALSSKDRT